MGLGRWLRCGLLVAALCSAPASALAQTREEAVQAARRGEYDAALSALSTLLAASPSDTATAFDLAVVLEWAGRARDTTSMSGRRALYVFDGIALREYAYELDGTGAGRSTAIAEEDRVRGQRAIREAVEGIARLYRYRQ